MKTPTTRRFSFLSGFKRTAKLFVKSKIGMIGAVIILFFILLAIFSPELTANDPVTGFNVASQYAIPTWATVLPWYHNVTTSTTHIVPESVWVSATNLSGWAISGANYTVGTSGNVPIPSMVRSLYINASVPTNETVSYSFSPDPLLPYGQVFFTMSKQFYFNGAVPPDFALDTQIYPIAMNNIDRLYVVFVVTTPTGNYTLASTLSYTLDNQIDFATDAIGLWNQVNISNGILADPTNGLTAFNNSLYDPTQVIFNGSGTYRLTMKLEGACSDNPANAVGYNPCGSHPSVSLLLAPIGMKFSAGAYGPLGTDVYGRDVWSQFVWGSRVSLLIGIASGIGAVALGALVGVAGGFIGGWVDEVIGRITDFVLVLPFLPLLIVVTFIITTNALLLSQVYLWVIIVFIVVSWPFIGRIIRAQVLSIKERSYVEASRALGSGTGRILWKHILPNVMGLVYSQVALNVSGFILTEAALDFLSVSIHPITTMTWGVMLTQALPDATTNSIHSYVWWWFFPPGIAIASLSLAFVLVGFALDSIFNPKLRAR